MKKFVFFCILRVSLVPSGQFGEIQGVCVCGSFHDDSKASDFTRSMARGSQVPMHTVPL